MGAKKIQSETFSSVDAAWLHMDSPSNLAMITGVMSFDRPLNFERLKKVFEYRLCEYPRFRQRVRESRLPLGLPRWEPDPNFDIDFHVLRVSLPSPGDHTALQQLVGELMSVPLNPAKPLWQFHYVENYGAGSALIGRLHHCIADGIALMQVVLAMCDSSPNAPWPEPPQDCEAQLSPLARLLRPAVGAVLTVNRTMRKGWRMAEGLVYEGMETLIHPSRLLDAARLTGSSALALSKLLLLPPDRKTIFKGKCGVSKTAAWSVTLKLDEVKAVGRLMGGTVNDVLLSAVTGALRRYLQERDQPVAGLNIRAIVPVNLRPPDELDQLGNRFGLVFLSLPIGVKDQIKRLIVLKRRMDEIKNSPEAVVALGILNAMGLSPIQIEKIILMIFGIKGTAVMTNVPGPRERLYMCGETVNNFMFWVPSPANLSMGVSIFSYAGEVTLGVATDACLIPDPGAIITHFHDEFEQMKRWGMPPERIGGEAGSELVGEAAIDREHEPEPESEADIEPLSGAEIEVGFEPDREPVTVVRAVTTAEAVAALETQLAVALATPLEVEVELVSDNGFCCAQTRSGQRCKNRALPGMKICRVHQAK